MEKLNVYYLMVPPHFDEKKALKKFYRQQNFPIQFTKLTSHLPPALLD